MSSAWRAICGSVSDSSIPDCPCLVEAEGALQQVAGELFVVGDLLRRGRAVELRQHRLGVEQIDVARPAVHEELNDGLRLRGGSGSASPSGRRRLWLLGSRRRSVDKASPPKPPPRRARTWRRVTWVDMIHSPESTQARRLAARPAAKRRAWGIQINFNPHMQIRCAEQHVAQVRQRSATGVAVLVARRLLRQKLLQPLLLTFRRRSAEGQANGVIHRPITAFLQDAASEGVGLQREEVAVEQRQRLRGDRRDAAACAVRLHNRLIEDLRATSTAATVGPASRSTAAIPAAPRRRRLRRRCAGSAPASRTSRY